MVSSEKFEQRGLSVLERNPLADLYKIRRRFFYKATPEKYPDLFKARIDLVEQQQQFREADEPKPSLYTLGYISEPLYFYDLLGLDPQLIDLPLLIFAQHRLEIPAKTIKPVSWIKVKPLPSLEYLRRPNQDDFAQIFEESDISPDLEHVSPTGPVDRETNEFLAYQLIFQENLQVLISDPRQLEDFAAQNGLKVDFKALLEGIQDLLADKAHVAAEEGKDISETYETGSQWSLMTAEHILRNSKKIDYLFPHSYPPARSRTCDIRLLPYMVMSLLHFVVDIPYLLREGQEYHPDELRIAVNNLYRLARESLVDRLGRRLQSTGDLVSLHRQAVKSEPQLAEEVRMITDIMRDFKPELDRLLGVFKSNPGLLNRGRSSFEPGSIPGYDELRQEVVNSGAKISEKTFKIRMKSRVHRGDI